MKIEVLGCHGSETPSAKSVGFLINDHILLEAGTAASVLTLERQQRIRNVIISHLHLDHIKSLPFLADNRIGEEGASIMVYGISEVVEGLKKHLFNDSIWPDFSKIENGRVPVLQFHTLVPGQSTKVAEVEILPVAARHSIPSVGILLREKDRSFLYTGDTASAEEIWEVASKTSDLVGLIIETSFPDRMQDIASVSGHMTPSVLARDIQKFNRPDVPVYIFHMKPKHESAIVTELGRLLGQRVRVLQEGETIHL